LLVFVDEAAEDASALDPLTGEVSKRMVRAGRAELPAVVGAPSVGVGLVPGKDRRRCRSPEISMRSVISVLCRSKIGFPL